MKLSKSSANITTNGSNRSESAPSDTRHSPSPHLLARLTKRGAELVGQVVQYQNLHRLCYLRGPEGILIGLAEQLTNQSARTNPLEK